MGEKPLMGKEKKKDKKDNKKKEDPDADGEKKGMVPDIGMPEMNCCDCCSCCDCDCEKMEEESKGEVCCCCWPLSSGVTWIGIFLAAWLLWQFVDAFMLIANDWIDSYFILVSFMLLILPVLGIIFFWIYYDKDKKSDRMLG